MLTKAMQRFNDYINVYEIEILKEQEILSKLDPIETDDDKLYKLQLRRNALRDCYNYCFLGSNTIIGLTI